MADEPGILLLGLKLMLCNPDAMDSIVSNKMDNIMAHGRGKHYACHELQGGHVVDRQGTGSRQGKDKQWIGIGQRTSAQGVDCWWTGSKQTSNETRQQQTAG